MLKMAAAGRGRWRRQRDAIYRKADAAEDITMGVDASWKAIWMDKCLGVRGQILWQDMLLP